MSKIVGDTACPQCRKNGGDRTGNHLILFEDGGAHCNRCGYSRPSTDGHPSTTVDDTPPPRTKSIDVSSFKSYPSTDLVDRGITAATCEYFGVKSELSEADGTTVTGILFPIYNNANDDAPTAYKKRNQDKSFVIYGSEKTPALFGQNKSPKTKTVYITEGEIDALTVYQALKEQAGSGYEHLHPAVMSIPNGAGGASRAIAENLRHLNGYDKIVICFDNDPAGQKATDEVCRLIGSKAHVAKLGSFKDANEMYLAGRKSDLKAALVFNAEKYMPAGIATVSDLLEEACSMPTYGLSYPWPSLTELTYGLKEGQLIGIAAGVGIGKTDWFSQLSAHLIEEHNESIALFKLEEPPSRSLKAIAGKIAGVPFHRPDVDFNKDDLRSEIQKLDGKVYCYNHFGYKEWGSIKADIRVLRAYGVRWFIVDPLTALVAHAEDEHKALNEMMEEMASLTQELGITIFYSSHLNPPPRGVKSHEEGGAVKESQLYGSRAMIRWSHRIFGLQRNKHALLEDGSPDYKERNTTKFVLLKDREFGHTGQFDIFYDEDTTRYLEPKKVYEEEMF
jgi:twinkle protein